jgi:hypothetical protein
VCTRAPSGREDDGVVVSDNIGVELEQGAKDQGPNAGVEAKTLSCGIAGSHVLIQYYHIISSPPNDRRLIVVEGFAFLLRSLELCWLKFFSGSNLARQVYGEKTDEMAVPCYWVK